MDRYGDPDNEADTVRRLTSSEAADVLNGTARYAHAVPVIREGSPLRQGSIYVDLTRLESGPFMAVAGQSATEGQLLVPRRMIDPDLWLQLVVHEGDSVSRNAQAEDQTSRT